MSGANLVSLSSKGSFSFLRPLADAQFRQVSLRQQCPNRHLQQQRDLSQRVEPKISPGWVLHRLKQAVVDAFLGGQLKARQLQLQPVMPRVGGDVIPGLFQRPV